ncbi:Serine/threonine-protein kinase ppk15 [Porphyridium purpureum]|uniref:Serine/threonine-protein kinase ppk15 n=1 Tax=Porphyridium purpureum TaxID=35688 RepID=A0A5J4YZF2_PORPP|nr:Serine/threonine-protein kinase ppk15 [Porphyridium purpureum]|eukprot:POR2590..scf209_3
MPPVGSEAQEYLLQLREGGREGLVDAGGSGPCDFQQRAEEEGRRRRRGRAAGSRSGEEQGEHVLSLRDADSSDSDSRDRASSLRSLHQQQKQRLLLAASVGLVATYKTLHPQYEYRSDMNPQRVLTSDDKPMHNHGLDNQGHDLILSANDILRGPADQGDYEVEDLLGIGTFGQVVSCRHLPSGRSVAVKVIKNLASYEKQARLEMAILDEIHQLASNTDTTRIIKLLNHFTYAGHLCLVFEKLSHNLFEVIQQNNYRGMDLSVVRQLVSQLLSAMVVLEDLRITHCDIKPENMMLAKSDRLDMVLIDFGSARRHEDKLFSYVQSRFYRAPEVILGGAYDTKIDAWSLGCVAAELMLGLPLFPGQTEYNMLQRITEMIGDASADFIERCPNAYRYYERVDDDDSDTSQPCSYYRLRLEREVRQSIASSPSTGAEGLDPNMNVSQNPVDLAAMPKASGDGGSAAGLGSGSGSWTRYFKHQTLHDIIMMYPNRKRKAGSAVAHDVQERKQFLDFLQQLLRIDPTQRWSAKQASIHPFVSSRLAAGDVRADSRPAAVRGSGPSSAPAPQYTAWNAPGAHTASGTPREAYNPLQRHPGAGERAGRVDDDVNAPGIDSPGNLEAGQSGYDRSVRGHNHQVMVPNANIIETSSGREGGTPEYGTTHACEGSHNDSEECRDPASKASASDCADELEELEGVFSE